MRLSFRRPKDRVAITDGKGGPYYTGMSVEEPFWPVFSTDANKARTWPDAILAQSTGTILEERYNVNVKYVRVVR